MRYTLKNKLRNKYFKFFDAGNVNMSKCFQKYLIQKKEIFFIINIIINLFFETKKERDALEI